MIIRRKYGSFKGYCRDYWFSITTVSRILNNDKTLRTSQNTKNIIKTVAEATGYKTLNEKKKERYKKRIL